MARKNNLLNRPSLSMIAGDTSVKLKFNSNNFSIKVSVYNNNKIIESHKCTGYTEAERLFDELCNKYIKSAQAEHGAEAIEEGFDDGGCANGHCPIK